MIIAMEYLLSNDIKAVHCIQGMIKGCRLCHKEAETTDLINGHDSNIIETGSSTKSVTLFDILQNITHMTIETQEVPHEFCSNCCHQLLSHYLFSLNCLEQEKKLHNLTNSLNYDTLESLKLKKEPDVESRSYYLFTFNPMVNSPKKNSETKFIGGSDVKIKRQNSSVFNPVKKYTKFKFRTSNHNADKTVKGGPCEFCGRMIASRTYLRHHRFICKQRDTNVLPDPDLKFICDLCNVTFYSKGRITFHMKTVHVARTIPCKICGKLFKTLYELKDHLVFHTNDRKHKCQYCDKGFNTPYDVVCHERIHTGEKPYLCSKCDLRFISSARRKAHFFAKHSEESAEGNICNLCNVSFPTKGLLQAHTKSVHVARTVPCQICGKMFKTLGQLKDHLIVHSDDRKYKCGFCGNGFKTQKCLVYHERIHTGEKPYPCSKCDLSFLSASRRTGHFLAKHCEKKAVCTICFSKFPSNSQVNQHMKKVHYKLNKECHS